MELQLPKGMRDFAPEEKILRDKIVRGLTNVFERYGFNPLETPIIERWNVLTAKFGAASEEQDIMKEVYKLTDQGERELGLRFDLTVPAARFVGMNPQLKMPFKRYQLGDVFRDGPIKLGRYRAFTQCDFDIFGSKKMLADAEIISVFLDGFTELDLDAELRVNNRKLLNEIIKAAGIKEHADSVIMSVDKLNKIGREGVTNELEQKGFKKTATKKLLDFFEKDGTNKELLVAVEKFLPKDADKTGLEELKEVLSLVDDERVVFTPSLARGLAYYTGTVFEGFFKRGEITSSICSGGRYDTMVGQLLGNNKEIAAVGGSFGLEPITEQLKLVARGKQGGLPRTVVKAFVIPIKCDAMPIVRQLRLAGVSTEIDIMARGISKNLEYANALDIPYVIIVGQRELDEGKVKLKDMVTGEERMVPPDELARELKAKFSDK